MCHCRRLINKGPLNILGETMMQVMELAKSLANRSASELKMGAFLAATRIVNLVKPGGDYLAIVMLGTPTRGISVMVI